MDYNALRHFADSWGLLLLTLFFVGVLVWVLRPGARAHYADQADIPFRHDDKGE
jgi:cytochrome c oxidase cbb3-type subunit 4